MSGTTIRLHAAVSVDGFCADADGGVAWLAAFDGEDTGAAAFQVMADALVLGRATYDQVRGFAERGIAWPYEGKRCYVLTTRPLDAAPPPGVQAISSVAALIARLNERAQTVWLVGGATTARTFLEEGALDEIELFTVPLLLGRGVPLLAGATPHRLTLVEQETYRNGMTRALYTVTSGR